MPFSFLLCVKILFRKEPFHCLLILLAEYGYACLLQSSCCHACTGNDLPGKAAVIDHSRPTGRASLFEDGKGAVIDSRHTNRTDCPSFVSFRPVNTVLICNGYPSALGWCTRGRQASHLFRADRNQRMLLPQLKHPGARFFLAVIACRQTQQAGTDQNVHCASSSLCA